MTATNFFVLMTIGRKQARHLRHCASGDAFHCESVHADILIRGTSRDESGGGQ
jgi:hypothetical protein